VNFPEERPKGDVSGLYPLVQGNSCASRSDSESTCPALVVFVRQSGILLQGAAGDAGSAGRSLIGSRPMWECHQVATSLRRFPKAANAIRTIARSCKAMAFDPLQAAGRRSRTSAVTCLWLVHWGSRAETTMARRRAFLIPEWSQGASAPFQRCGVVRLRSRSEMVLGACAPPGTFTDHFQRSTFTLSGIPQAGSIALRSGPRDGRQQASDEFGTSWSCQQASGRGAAPGPKFDDVGGGRGACSRPFRYSREA
jgi:hypothetical protein